MTRSRMATSKRSTQGRGSRPQDSGSRGTALVEFAMVLPLILVILLGTIDFGHLIQTRLILTNVSREGGSIASRQTPIDPNLAIMLLASGRPLVLGGPDGKLIITRITAGQSVDEPQPAITATIEQGRLGVSSHIGSDLPQLGLSTNLYNHLVYDVDNSTADITDITVVEVFYKYRPITPLAGFVPGLLHEDEGGFIIGSKAVF